MNNTVQYTLGNFSLSSVFIFFILFFSFFAHFKQRIPPFAPFAFRFKIGGFPQVIEPDTVSLDSSPVLDDPCIVKHVSRERFYIYVLYKYKCVRNTRIRVVGDRRISTLRIHSDFEKDTIGFDDLLFWGGRGGWVVNLLPNDHGFRKTIVNKWIDVERLTMRMCNKCRYIATWWWNHVRDPISKKNSVSLREQEKILT